MNVVSPRMVDMLSTEKKLPGPLPPPGLRPAVVLRFRVIVGGSELHVDAVPALGGRLGSRHSPTPTTKRSGSLGSGVPTRPAQVGMYGTNAITLHISTCLRFYEKEIILQDIC
jgi:hypothetical protein